MQVCRHSLQQRDLFLSLVVLPQHYMPQQLIKKLWRCGGVEHSVRQLLEEFEQRGLITQMQVNGALIEKLWRCGGAEHSVTHLLEEFEQRTLIMPISKKK